MMTSAADTDWRLEYVTRMVGRLFDVKEASASWAGEYVVSGVHGQIVLWREETDTFHVMSSIPNASGLVDIHIMPEAIHSLAELTDARRTLDERFRDQAQYVIPRIQAGFALEDLFYHLCIRLGFVPDYKAPEGTPFTIRRGSIHEDRMLKIDFVLRIPVKRGVIPLQLTMAHSTTVNAEKLRRVMSAEVAYLATDQFFPSTQSAILSLRRATEERNNHELWRWREILTLVCGRFRRFHVDLPEVTFEDEFVDYRYINEMGPYFIPSLQTRLTAIRQKRTSPEEITTLMRPLIIKRIKAQRVLYTYTSNGPVIRPEPS